jgi:hypothetical protein
MNIFLVEAAARAAHEVNRMYCLSLGDASQPNWEDAPDWQKDSARNGARLHLSGEHSAAESHASWLAQKEAEGWKYGPVKDVARKEHPCMVPYEELPREQKAKDWIFVTVVKQIKLAWNAGIDEGLRSV